MSDKLTVTGLTPLEVRELESALGKPAREPLVKEIGNVRPDARFSEPTALIIATVVLSIAALTTLAIIVGRARKSTRREIQIDYKAGDKTLSYSLKENSSSTESPHAEVVKEIGKALNIDLERLGGIIKPGK